MLSTVTTIKLDTHTNIYFASLADRTAYEIRGAGPDELTAAALRICGQAKGFQILYLDIIQGGVNWALENPEQSRFDLSGIESLSILPVFNFTPEQLLAQLIPKLSKKCLIVIDSVDRLAWLMHIQNPVADDKEIQMRLISFLDALQQACQATHSVLLMLKTAPSKMS